MEQLPDGNAQHLEVSSKTDKDGKTSIHVTKSETKNGKVENKSWTVDSVEKLPDEIQKEVETFFDFQQ